LKTKQHYLVYQITNLINGKIYIGIHSTKNINDGYMGSGKNLRAAIKEFGIENFKKEILFDFDNPEEMIAKEIELVDRKFISHLNVYNIKLGGEGWQSSNMVPVKDIDGNRLKVHKTDERYLKGELKHISAGNVTVRDTSGKTFNVSIDDPRYLSGELQFILIEHHKNKILSKDLYGNAFLVSTDDERLKSGELINFWIGRNHSEKTKQIISEKSKIHQKGEGNSQFGTCWIHSIELKENKKIKKTELNSFLSEGWIKGRKMKF